jgi:alkylated DNA nucleotide flippase Atl1
MTSEVEAGLLRSGVLAMKCIHGIDARFCSVCNRRETTPLRSSVADALLDEILCFLNHEQVRATYGAVAELLGVTPRSMGSLLGPRRPEASWIVSVNNGLPTDYSQDEWHPELLSHAEVIGSGSVLRLKISVWRAREL